MSKTKGARALKSWLTEKPRGAQADLAQKLGVSRPCIPQWVSGKSRPNETNRRMLEIVTGIPFGDWATGRERQREARVQQSAA